MSLAEQQSDGLGRACQFGLKIKPSPTPDTAISGEREMGKIRISQLAEVEGVLRWSLRVEDRLFFYCTLGEDGTLTIYHEGHTERLAGCSVHAASLPKAMRAVYALCGSKGVQEALARLSVTPSAQI